MTKRLPKGLDCSGGDQLNIRNILVSGENFVKQTQHHLKVQIGNNEAVHQTTTQVHTAAQPKVTHPDSTNRHGSVTNESHAAIMDLLGAMQVTPNSGAVSRLSAVDALSIQG